MSADEAFDLKQQFLHDAEVAMRRQLTAAERVLLKMIFEQLVDKFSTDGGKLLPTEENFDTLARFGPLYQQFLSSQVLPIAAKLATSFLRLPGLNGDYFQAEINTPKMKATVARIVGASGDYLRAKLGLTATGNLKPGAYLADLVQDPTVRNELRRIMANAIDSGGDLTAVRNAIRDYLIGGPVMKDGVRLDVRRAGALEKRFEQFAFDALQAADRNVGRQFAVELGLQVAVYRGGIIEETRKFCCQLNGKAWTVEEMEAFDKEEWSGKKGAVQIDGGGYNCRHTWRYVNEVRALRLRPDLEEGLDGKLVPKAGSTPQEVNDDCEDAKGSSTLGSARATAALVAGKPVPNSADPSKDFSGAWKAVNEMPVDELTKLASPSRHDGITPQWWLGERSGLNGKPYLASKEEAARFAQDPNVVTLFRGLSTSGSRSAKSMIEQLIRGEKAFGGRGVYGDGTYFAAQRHIALEYASGKGSNVVTAYLDRSTARIATWEKLYETWQRDRELVANARVALDSGRTEAEQQVAFEQEYFLYGDFGSWATARGYDAIFVEQRGFYVVLNRTKLVFEQ